MRPRNIIPSRLLLLFFCVSFGLHAQSTTTSLNGTWNFALDPVDVGVQQEWFNPSLPTEKWDKVTVPHCFTVDPRYHYFTGNAWYLRSFPKGAATSGGRTFLRFEAAFYQAQVWLNGKRIGEHEGGYTPFEFDVTDLLAEQNFLAVRVNNSWSTTTMPGAKTKVDYQSPNAGQLYPWMNYGGLTREVSLITHPDVYLDKIKIEAVPDLAAGTARLHISTLVQNRSAQPWDAKHLGLTVFRNGNKVELANLRVVGADIAAQASASIQIDASLAREDVALWSFDRPVLYQAELSADRDRAKISFGIRSVTVRGTKLLLNGEAIALGGCNRPMDSPGNGSLDPEEILQKDLKLMKSAGMELSRIAHYPVSSQLLEWADRHGMLIIAEAGNWQMTPAQMADPMMRKKFQSQMREMIERDWNHPAVIAWSVGNEYQSQTDEGKAWTKDMSAFAKSLDSSRLITFASNVVARPTIKKPEDEASQFVDFVSANIYGGHLESLRRIHALYPDKPVYVSEFGQRTDAVKSEQDRVEYLRRAIEAFRQCDFLIGASVWTFNDYESLYPGSNANGYRPWGLVSPSREPREMYYAWQKEFSPAVVSMRRMDSGQIEVTVTARKDFPSYTLHNYRLKAGSDVFDISSLPPGASQVFKINAAAESSARFVELEKPGGFVILKASFSDALK